MLHLSRLLLVGAILLAQTACTNDVAFGPAAQNDRGSSSSPDPVNPDDPPVVPDQPTEPADPDDQTPPPTNPPQDPTQPPYDDNNPDIPPVDPPPVDPPPVEPPPVEPPPPVTPPPVLPPPPPPYVPPVTPPPVLPPPPPPFEPPVTPPPAGDDWDLSSKAKKLIRIMYQACQEKNRSEPKGYVAPTRAELESRLRACTPEIYPDTVMTPAEVETIGSLLRGEKHLYKHMFSGLWYRPPYSDQIDTYFGLGVAEAVQILCYKEIPALTGNLLTYEMWQEWHDKFFWEWPERVQNEFNALQHVRSGLMQCLDK